MLKQGFLFKLPSDDLSPENRYKIAWSMKDCIDVSFPPVDEAKGPTLNLIMKKGYKANGREPDLETVVLVADSAEERNLWFGALVAAKSKRQFQFQFNAAVGLPSGPASLSAGHAANVYGNTIAEELSKLRLDMSDIKKDVSTMKVENRENADAILDQAERIEDTVEAASQTELPATMPLVLMMAMVVAMATEGPRCPRSTPILMNWPPLILRMRMGGSPHSHHHHLHHRKRL